MMPPAVLLRGDTARHDVAPRGASSVRRALLVLIVLAPTALALPVPTPIGPTGEVATDRAVYHDGDTMAITFTNPSDVTLDLYDFNCWSIRDPSGQFTFVPAPSQTPSVGCTEVAPGGSVTFVASYAYWSTGESRLAPGEYTVVVPYRHGEGVLPLGTDDRDDAVAHITVCTPARRGPIGFADAAFHLARC